MIASLPMYDTPATRAANDRFWQAICAAGNIPKTALDHESDPHDTWLSPHLVFSQTCGMPFRTDLHETVSLIGTPDYGVAQCPPGYYRSCIVVRSTEARKDLADFAAARLARNDRRSQSGWAAPWQHFQKCGGFRGTIIETGAHAASVDAVAQDRADIAAIDAVTWALLQRDTPERTAGLSVVEYTDPTPGLPFITANSQDALPLRRAVADAIAHLSDDDRRCLMLNALVYIPAADYLRVPSPE